MLSQGPYHWFPPSAQRPAFWVFLVLAIGLMLTLNALGRPLVGEAAPAGIVSYELAGNLDQARRILDAWGSEAQVYAGLNLGLDYLFLIAYPIAIGLGCLLVSQPSRSGPGRLVKVGALLGWALLAAGALDALENYALIRLLLGSGNPLWPAVARVCAIPKFLIVGVGLLFVLGGAALRLPGVIGRSSRPVSGAPGG